MRKKHNKSELPIKLIKTDRRKKKDKQNYAEPLYIGEGRFLIPELKPHSK
jgi:hypothetical protein